MMDTYSRPTPGAPPWKCATRRCPNCKLLEKQQQPHPGPYVQPSDHPAMVLRPQNTSHVTATSLQPRHRQHLAGGRMPGAMAGR
jgi:hypothetical protein